MRKFAALATAVLVPSALSTAALANEINYLVNPEQCPRGHTQAC
jgi:hypothetical protein